MDTTWAAVDPLIGGREVEPANPDSTRFYKEMLGYLLGDQLHRHVRSTIVISRRDFRNLADLQQMADSIEDRHRVILERLSRRAYERPDHEAQARRDHWSPNYHAEVVYPAWAQELLEWGKRR